MAIRRITYCVLAMMLCGSLATAQQKILAGSNIYIEKMDNDLDGFIRAEFIKQHVPMTVVLSADDADLVVTGSGSKDEKRSWSEGWLTFERDHNIGNIMIVQKGSKTMLWAGEAGDRSWFWGSLARGGQRKVASRLVKNIKKAIGPSVVKASNSK